MTSDARFAVMFQNWNHFADLIEMQQKRAKGYL